MQYLPCLVQGWGKSIMGSFPDGGWEITSLAGLSRSTRIFRGNDNDFTVYVLQLKWVWNNQVELSNKEETQF